MPASARSIGCVGIMGYQRRAPLGGSGRGALVTHRAAPGGCPDAEASVACYGLRFMQVCPAGTLGLLLSANGTGMVTSVP